jgi:hypothetical protein
MRHGFGIASALLVVLSINFAHAAPVKTTHVEAELIARHTAIVPGQPVEAVLGQSGRFWFAD